MLSTRFGNEIDINLKLSINFVLYVDFSLLSSSFLIGTEKKYFSVFSPKHSNCPSNSFASSLIMKNRYKILQDFFLVFDILECRYCKQNLYIFQ